MPISRREVDILVKSKPNPNLDIPNPFWTNLVGVFRTSNFGLGIKKPTPSSPGK